MQLPAPSLGRASPSPRRPVGSGVCVDYPARKSTFLRESQAGWHEFSRWPSRTTGSAVIRAGSWAAAQTHNSGLLGRPFPNFTASAMRRIGSFSDGSLARQFCDYLVTQSIESTTESDQEGSETVWNIWIRDERDLERAREEFAAFQAAPHEERYQVETEVERIRSEQVAEQQRRIKQHRKLVQSMPRRSGSQFGPMIGGSAKQQNIPVTIAVIVISVAASFMTNMCEPKSRADRITLEQQVYFAMSFVDPREYIKSEGDPFASLRQGEIWRVVTPMFLHGGIMHLVFNMLWIYSLGSALERLHGSLLFLLLLLGAELSGTALTVVTIDMDFLPEALRGSAFSIGASGAVYGLFGFLWIRPQIDQSYPIRLAPLNVALMLGWLVICMTPVVDRVANGAHVGGLLGGIVAAFLWRSRHG